MSLSSVLCSAEALDYREREQSINVRDGWCRLLKEMEELCLEWCLFLILPETGVQCEVHPESH